VEISAQVSSVETTNATTANPLAVPLSASFPSPPKLSAVLSLSAGTQSELNASAQLGRGNARVIVNGQREDNNKLFN